MRPGDVNREGEVTPHEVQLFDSFESRVDAIAAFVHDGLRGGDNVLVVCTDDHWTALVDRLGEAAADAAACGLVRRDAAAMLRTFVHCGTPNADRFEATVGALVRQLGSNGRRLRVYGEMVDLLARQGEFEAARELEDLWNDLRRRWPFVLFCGYSAVSFGDPRAAAALRSICDAHSHVRSDPQDVLGTFLLTTYRVR